MGGRLGRQTWNLACSIRFAAQQPNSRSYFQIYLTETYYLLVIVNRFIRRLLHTFGAATQTSWSMKIAWLIIKVLLSTLLNLWRGNNSWLAEVITDLNSPKEIAAQRCSRASILQTFHRYTVLTCYCKKGVSYFYRCRATLLQREHCPSDQKGIRLKSLWRILRCRLNWNVKNCQRAHLAQITGWCRRFGAGWVFSRHIF